MTSQPDAQQDYSVLLASGSPQRSAILEQLGYAFRIVIPDVEEIAHGNAVSLAEHNALIKARSCAAVRASDEIVLAVDTVVSIDDTVYGKPSDEREAAQMLSSLRGRGHSVIGGLALIVGDGDVRVHHAATTVRFREFSDELLNSYLASGEWRGRAGGYAIQGTGASLVAAVDGDFWNVVGLPVAMLHDLIDEQQITLRRASFT